MSASTRDIVEAAGVFSVVAGLLLVAWKKNSLSQKYGEEQ
jgi:hypothetical protein